MVTADKNRKTSVTVICGFLGAGKTTLLRYLIDNIPPSEKAVVLVNDFGSVNIDGQILQRGGLDIVPLSSGCVCCSLKGSLVSTIQQIHSEFAPDKLFIEPSGVASPGSIIESLTEDILLPIVALDLVITVIDTLNFLTYRKNMGEFFQDQLEIADLIILNKQDLVQPEQLLKIKEVLMATNTKAELIPAKFGVIPNEKLNEKTQKKLFSIFAHHHEHMEFETFEVKIESELFDRTKILQFLNSLEEKKYGNVLRAKGIVAHRAGYVLINYVPGQVDIQDISEGIPSVIFLGSQLNEEMLRKEFFSCLRE